MKLLRIVLTSFLLSGVLAAGPLLGSEGVDRAQLAETVDRLAAEALENGAVGLSVAVSLGGDVIVEAGYGLAEVEHQADVTGATPFRIGSITKQFTAAAVMRLVESGEIELDAPISRYLPDYPLQGKVVTVRQLLTHTSGIKSYTSLGEGWMRTVPLEMTDEQLIDLFEDEPFDFEPDERFLYNNSGYYLLGVMVSKVTEKPWHQFVHDALLAPLELDSIRNGSNADIIAGRAQGYRMVEGELENDQLIGMSQPGAAGALLAPAGGLVRWQWALVNGRVVSPESYQQMITPHTLSDGNETGYGFGLTIGEDRGQRVVAHGGGINGFNSMLAFYPEVELGVAVLSNSEGYRSKTLADQIAGAALGLESAVSDLDIPSDELERLAGSYSLTGAGLVMRVWSEEGRLYAQATGQGRTRLRLQADGEFRPDFDDAVRIVFTEEDPAAGFTLHQGGAKLAAERVESTEEP